MDKVHTTKFTILFIIVSCLIISIICCVLKTNETAIKEVELDNLTEKMSNDNIRFCIDEGSIETNEGINSICINGWIIEKGTPTNNVAIHVIVSGNEKSYLLPTQVVSRAEITTHFNDGKNYDNSAFKVSIDTKISDINENSKIYLLYDISNQRYLVDTGVTLKKKVK